MERLVIPLYLAAVPLALLTWVEVDAARAQDLAARGDTSQAVEQPHRPRAIALGSLTGLAAATGVALSRAACEP